MFIIVYSLAPLEYPHVSYCASSLCSISLGLFLKIRSKSLLLVPEKVLYTIFRAEEVIFSLIFG